MVLGKWSELIVDKMSWNVLILSMLQQIVYTQLELNY